MGKRKILLLINCLTFFTFIQANGYLSYGPDIKSSVGDVWPKPLWQADSGHYFGVDPKNFELVVGVVVVLQINKHKNYLKKPIN